MSRGEFHFLETSLLQCAQEADSSGGMTNCGSLLASLPEDPPSGSTLLLEGYP